MCICYAGYSYPLYIEIRYRVCFYGTIHNIYLRLRGYLSKLIQKPYQLLHIYLSCNTMAYANYIAQICLENTMQIIYISNETFQQSCNVESKYLNPEQLVTVTPNFVSDIVDLRILINYGNHIGFNCSSTDVSLLETTAGNPNKGHVFQYSMSILMHTLSPILKAMAVPMSLILVMSFIT